MRNLDKIKVHFHFKNCFRGINFPLLENAWFIKAMAIHYYQPDLLYPRTVSWNTGRCCSHMVVYRLVLQKFDT